MDRVWRYLDIEKFGTTIGMTVLIYHEIKSPTFPILRDSFSSLLSRLLEAMNDPLCSQGPENTRKVGRACLKGGPLILIRTSV